MKITFKVKSKAGIIICIVCFAIIVIVGLLNPSEEGPSIDSDKFSIDTVTEEEKLDVVCSCEGWFVSEGNWGSRSGVNDEKYKELDCDKSHYSARKATGIKTMMATLAKDCTLSFDIDSTADGDAKIIVIIDSIVVDEFDFGQKDSLTYEIEGEKTVYIKIICDNAKVNITVQRIFS